MPTLKQLDQEIQQIKTRNRRVETDKLWETSKTRKILVLILTYIVISIFFVFAGLPYPFLNSIVPAIAFVLSTSSIPFFRKIWLKHIHKKSPKS